jgi:glycosyltransferase involved in cell wall biosynthesis
MPDIGGLRLYGLAKNLPRYGWEPIILTQNLPEKPDSAFQVIQTPYDDIITSWKKRFKLDPKKSLNQQFNAKRKKNGFSLPDSLALISSELIAYPDHYIGWYDYAVSEGRKIIRTEQIDAIISSSTPVTCHLIAKTLSEQYNIPWLADFRDLWTQNHYFKHSRLRNYFERKLELTTLNQASAITTVSEPLAEKLNHLHTSKPVFSIRNGFDPDAMNPGISLDDKFRIKYTGILYQGKRDPAALLAALYEMSKDGSIDRHDIRIDFYGHTEDWLWDDIHKYQLQDLVTLHGHVSREISIAEQRKAQILLLLSWDDPAERGVYTGKLFDYLAARRPILSMGYKEGGVVRELLEQTQAGVHVSNDKEVRTFLLKAYHEFKENGAVQYRGIEVEIMKYSHGEMAKKFAEVLQLISP